MCKRGYYSFHRIIGNKIKNTAPCIRTHSLTHNPSVGLFTRSTRSTDKRDFYDNWPGRASGAMVWFLFSFHVSYALIMMYRCAMCVPSAPSGMYRHNVTVHTDQFLKLWFARRSFDFLAIAIKFASFVHFILIFSVQRFAAYLRRHVPFCKQHHCIAFNP